MDSRKRKFLHEFDKIEDNSKDSCGYHDQIDNIRTKEYTQLSKNVYLDNAGAALFPQSLPHRYAEVLTRQQDCISGCTESPIWGNPHSASSSPAALSTSNRIAALRTRILKDIFNVPVNQLKQWDVIFTANATAAIKLVADNFPWKPSSRLGLLKESNHTSAIGTAKVAEEHGVDAEFILLEDASQWISQAPGSSLFIYPAQCNFTGRRYKVITKSSKCRILVDAASYLSTSEYTMDDIDAAPDFIAVSFYKIYGFPTGLGALIAKEDAVRELKKRYFGGGTVSAVAVSPLFSQLRDDGPSRFEDGTVNFLGLLALEEAMNVHKELFGSLRATSAHVNHVSEILVRLLSSLQHYNGQRLVVLYGRDAVPDSSYGPIVSFNMIHADGSWIGHADVARLAGIRGIHLRTGGMCNPGALQENLGLTADDIQANALTGHVCWDDQDILNGKPTGAIRVSLGAYSSINDVIAFIDFLEEFFVEARRQSVISSTGSGNTFVLSRITVYPIKSCHGTPVNQWQVQPQGLLYDREWMIVEQSTRNGLSQKRYPKMCLIRAEIDFQKRELVISKPVGKGFEILRIPLDDLASLDSIESTIVCNDPVLAIVYEKLEIVEFFSSFLGLQCTLARCKADRHAKDSVAEMRLSNESPFLFISAESIQDIQSRIANSTHDILSSFRGNFLIEGAPAYQEDTWARLEIGQQGFDMLGPCRRCNMVCIDQDTGIVYKEPFSTLSKHRRANGRVWFGQHARVDETRTLSIIRVGDPVHILALKEKLPLTPPKSPR